MRSVADELRRRAVPAPRPAGREIERVLALGRRDVELYARARGLSVAEARRRLQRQRQTGRAPSASMDARTL